MTAAVSKSSVDLELLLLQGGATCDPTLPASAKIGRQHELFESYVGALENYFARSGVNTDIGLIASFRLAVADKALKKGCFDIADKQYRQVMSIYSGSSYSALRDRAKIGIEDIRDARRREDSRNRKALDGADPNGRPATERISPRSSLDRLEEDTYRGFDRPK